MGDGSSPSSLSHAGIWRPASRAASFPTLFSTASGVYRPRSRAVQRLAAIGLSSEAFQLAWTGVCGTGLRTRRRHACDCFSASSPLSARSAAVFDGAFAQRHGSRLLTLRLPFIHKPAVAFLPSPAFRKVFTGPAEAACPSRFERSLCAAFQRLSFG
jgi:hypothetical protein